MLKNLFASLLLPGNAIAATAGLISIGMTIVVVTSGTEIVVEERAQAIIRQSNGSIRPELEKTIQGLENEKLALETKLADVIADNDPKQCGTNSTAKICTYLQNELEKQRRQLEANCDERITLLDGASNNDLNKRLTDLRQSLDQQCKSSLSDQEARLKADCDQKLARLRADLEKEWEAKLRQALADQDEKHAAELAAQKEKLDREYEELIAKMRQALADQNKKYSAEITALNEKHSAEIAALQKRYDRLQKRYDGLKKKYDGLQSKYTTLRTQYSDLKEKYDALEKSCSRIIK